MSLVLNQKQHQQLFVLSLHIELTTIKSTIIRARHMYIEEILSVRGKMQIPYVCSSNVIHC